MNGNISYVGSRLSFENCQMHRFGDPVAAVIVENDSTIENVMFNGFGMMNAGSVTPVPSLLNIGSGSVGQIVINSIDSNNISAPVSEFSTVGSVSGAGVLATGWEFPDTVMADGVPYISASTGLPSIKINGVVEPYPG